jgi:excisionase family DNA binding protein
LTGQQQVSRQQLLNLLFGETVPAVLDGTMLRTSDVALLFEVSERTVSEWARRGQIPSVRTPGGHRRYPAEGIKNLLEESRRTHTSPGRDNGSGGGDGVSVTALMHRHLG